MVYSKNILGHSLKNGKLMASIKIAFAIGQQFILKASATYFKNRCLSMIQFWFELISQQ